MLHAPTTPYQPILIVRVLLRHRSHIAPFHSLPCLLHVPGREQLLDNKDLR
jgi:hypothetical protein